MDKKPVALVREAVRRSRSPFHGDVLGLLHELEVVLASPIADDVRKKLVEKVQALALLVRAHDVGVQADKPAGKGVRILRMSLGIPEDMLLDPGYSDTVIADMADRASEMTTRELTKVRDELRKTSQS